MFLQWFINLRQSGVPVTLPEWLDLMQAMEHGAVTSLNDLYNVGMCLLVKSENRYDDYDLAFSASFGDGQIPTELSAQFEDWLSNPKVSQFDPATIAAASHVIGSLAATFGANGVSEKAVAQERAAARTPVDPDFRAGVELLVEEVRRLADALDARRTSVADGD